MLLNFKSITIINLIIDSTSIFNFYQYEMNRSFLNITYISLYTRLTQIVYSQKYPLGQNECQNEYIL